MQKKYQDLELQKDMLLKKTLSLLRDALKENDAGSKKEGLESSLEKLSRQKEFLLDKLLDGTISDTDYKAKNYELTVKIGQLNEELKNLEDSILQNAKLEGRIEMIREKLEGGIIEQAKIADMLGNIKKIRFFRISWNSILIPGQSWGCQKNLVPPVSGMKPINLR